jgi:predicted nucleotidyltransferase
MPTADRLCVAVERLVAAAQPKQIILFGSYARGDADDYSDIDLLVVERIVGDRYEEMIRLNRALKGLVMPVDLLVVGEQEFEVASLALPWFAPPEILSLKAATFKGSRSPKSDPASARRRRNGTQGATKPKLRTCVFAVFADDCVPMHLAA